jgi:hypothetical protein
MSLTRPTARSQRAETGKADKISKTRPGSQDADRREKIDQPEGSR